MTVIVVYLSMSGFLHILLVAEPVSCQGLFVNTCTKKRYPEEYLALEYIFVYLKNLRSTDPIVKPNLQLDDKDVERCIVLHMGANILLKGEHQSVRKCSLNLQCELWCQAYVEFTKFYGEDYFRHVPPTQRQRREHEILLLMSQPTNYTVPFNSTGACDEGIFHPHKLTVKTQNKHNVEYVRPAFHYWLKIPDPAPAQGYFSFGTDLIPQTDRQLADTFHVTESGVSYSYRFLTVRYKVCNKSNLYSLELSKSPKLNMGKKEMCLEMEHKKHSSMDLVLALHIQGVISNNFLGTFHHLINMCVSLLWVRDMIKYFPLQFEYLGLSLCIFVQSETTRIEWTADLTKAMILAGNRVVQVDLLGKIFAALFRIPSNKSCLHTTCTFEFFWARIQNKQHPKESVSLEKSFNILRQKTFEQLHFGKQYALKSLNYRGHFYNLFFVKQLRLWSIARSLQISWYDANRTCCDSNSNLPSFVSQAEILQFMSYLTSLPKQFFMSAMFIGLHRQVTLQGDSDIIWFNLFFVTKSDFSCIYLYCCSMEPCSGQMEDLWYSRCGDHHTHLQLLRDHFP